MGFRLSRLLGKKKTQTKITGVNISWRGGFHRIDGFMPKGNPFEFKLPFTNASEVPKIMERTLKSDAGVPIVIKGISIDPPFQLIKSSPELPLEVKAQEHVDIMLSIHAPKQSYSGPMIVRMSSQEEDRVRVELSGVTLQYKNKKVKVENSQKFMELKKGQIFRHPVQMYKILSLGNTIKRVTTSKPFEFVSSDPKLPFRVDNKNSYIVSFYIRAPDANYAGPLELTFE